MTDISCKDLIEIFEKIGGKIVINYNNKTCTYDEHISREFKNFDDWHSFDKILWNYQAFYHEIAIETKAKHEIKKFHHFQDTSVSEIILQTRRDDQGYLKI